MEKEKDIIFGKSLEEISLITQELGMQNFVAKQIAHWLYKKQAISFENMKRAIIYGSALASFCVEKFGTERMQNLTDEEVEKRVKEFITLVQFDISIVEA